MNVRSAGTVRHQACRIGERIRTAWRSRAWGFQDNEQHLILMNAYWEPVEFALPPALPQSAGWHRFIDTAMPGPFDVNEPSRAPRIATGAYTMRPRSVVVLINKKAQQAALPEGDQANAFLY
ncbi:MAG TPA: hypothetical protein VGH37_14100 [Candidatus Acidoferrum sp.]